jgi:uncharacterized membrane protein required for colicin V production
MGWMDVLIVVILMINGIHGWQRGFILTIFSMMSFLIAGLIAKIYHPVLSDYILRNPRIFIFLQEMVGKKVETASAMEGSTIGAEANHNIFDVLKLPKGLGELLMKSETMQDYSARAMEGVQSYIADVLTRMFIDLISILILFMVVKLVLNLLAHVLHGIASLPILNSVNHLGGLSVGVAKGLLIVFIFLTLITPFTAMTEQSIFTEGLEDAVLGKYLYDHNPIIAMFERITEI